MLLKQLGWVSCFLIVFSVTTNGQEMPKNPGGGKIEIPKNIGGLKIEIPKGLDTNPSNWAKKDFIDPKLVENFKFGDGKETDANGELTCIHFLKKMAMKGLPAFNECMKEMQLTIGKLKKRLKQVLPCIVKCIGIKMKILNPDGHFNIDYAKNMLKENVPKRFMEFIWKVWDECEEYVRKLKPDDPTCKTYRPIIKCAIDAAFKVAAEVMKLCPDIPDVFKNTAKSFVKSKNQQKEFRKIIE